jgi:hypothetical protein
MNTADMATKILPAFTTSVHHYIRKLIFDGWCKLIKIPSKMNTEDLATKILPAFTTSVFSRIVLGLPDFSHKGTDSD